jgi:membrane associated rhomboid family serine protease
MIPLRDAAGVRRPVMTTALIAACGAAFVLELWVEATHGLAGLDDLFRNFGVVPDALASSLTSGDLTLAVVVPLVTYQFLHAGWLHLAGNLLYLWIFGNNVEDRLGAAGFLLFYLGAGVVAALVQVAIEPTSDVPLIGASGAISAVLGAYLVLYPRAKVMSLVFLGFFFTLLEVPALILLGLWFALQLLDGVLALGGDTSAGVAFFAHIGGFLIGCAVGLVIRRVDPARSMAT